MTVVTPAGLILKGQQSPYLLNPAYGRIELGVGRKFFSDGHFSHSYCSGVASPAPTAPITTRTHPTLARPWIQVLGLVGKVIYDL